MRAAIYCRISLDKEGEGQGVERQLEDCRRLIEERGWTLTQEYIDNDVSAFSGRRRPEFERLLHDLLRSQEDGPTTVVVWRTDRLARRGRDLQRFIDTGATITSCTEPEFTGATGLLMLRILAGFAEHESGVKSERVARKMRQKAERGDPHAGGKRCYGFTVDGRELVEEEAAVIRDAAARVLAGETVTDVFRGWDKVPTGSVGNFRRLLRSPRMAGMREVAGELVEGNFPAILDRATWDRIQATVKIRKLGKRSRGHLLTGLLVCGRCGAQLSGSPQGYRCPSPLAGGCGRINVALAQADAEVVRVALDRIPADEVERSTEDEVDRLLDALREVEAKISQLAKDHYVAERISRPAYLAANDELEHRAQLLRMQIADHEAGESLGSLQEIAEHWDGQTLSYRQAVLRALLERVEVLPARSTRAPAGERLRFLWRDRS